MANGTTTLSLLVSETPSSPKPPCALATMPAAPCSSIELEKIGNAVAACAIAIAAAVNDACQHGGMLDPTYKEQGAIKLAAVAQLALDHMGSDADFIRKGREAAHVVLRGYFTDVSPALVNAVIDAAIDPVFEITVPIIERERIFRVAWSN